MSSFPSFIPSNMVCLIILVIVADTVSGGVVADRKTGVADDVPVVEVVVFIPQLPDEAIGKSLHSTYFPVSNAIIASSQNLVSNLWYLGFLLYLCEPHHLASVLESSQPFTSIGLFPALLFVTTVGTLHSELLVRTLSNSS